MGRRSRRREPAAPRARATAPAPPRREAALDRLSPARKVLAIYLGCAMVTAVVVVLGIAALGGSLGPFIVLAVALLAGGGAFTWSGRRLDGLALSDEDRMLQTLAGGLLLISVVLAVALVVLTAL